MRGRRSGAVRAPVGDVLRGERECVGTGRSGGASANGGTDGKSAFESACAGFVGNAEDKTSEAGGCCLAAHPGGDGRDFTKARSG